MGFPRQEYWSGLPVLLQEIFLIQGSNPRLLHLMYWQMGTLPLGPSGKPRNLLITRTGMVGPLTRQGPGIPVVPVDFMRRSYIWYHVGWASLQEVTCHLCQQLAAKPCAPSVNKGPWTCKRNSHSWCPRSMVPSPAWVKS